MKKLVGVLIWLVVPMLVSAANLEGRVVKGDEPVRGVVVSAFTSLDFQTTPVASSQPSNSEGYYSLDLPEGTYALYGWSADQSLFAFSGRNPVNLGVETVWVGMQGVPVAEAMMTAYDDQYSAAIEGRVLSGGRPLADAYVYLYLDVAEDLKGQGYRLSMPTGDDGYFRFDGLPESDYYLVARQRQNGQRVGPVQAGDRFGIYAGNPVTARAGQVQQLQLYCVEKVQEATESETFGRATGPVLTGTVVDKSGAGVSGVHVFAYVDRVIGHQRPAAISTPTKADGRFVVNLPTPGTYYVGARQEYGDSPAPGELFGMFDESADHGLTLEKGEQRDDVKIIVEPIKIF